MKQRGDTRNVELQGVESVSNFSIKTAAKAFRILSDGLYTNKVQAVLRELGCNARDAQVENGNGDEPFSVKLPNRLDPEFRVRDYGTGLSREAVQSLYTTYFESTKSDSNDYVGAMGLGSKSPFSYTDSFTVTSWFDGERHDFVCFIGADGAPSVTHAATVESDEPTGLEIKFSCKPSDFASFTEEAKRVFSWFEVKPKITGGGIDPEMLEIDVLDDGDRWLAVKNNGLRGQFAARMGGVVYPIDIHEISRFSRNSAEPMPEVFDTVTDQERFVNFCDSLRNYGSDRILVLEFDLGDVDVAASREALSMDETTKRNTVARAQIAMREIGDRLEDYINLARSPASYLMLKAAVQDSLGYGQSEEFPELGALRCVSHSVDWTYQGYIPDRFTRRRRNDPGKFFDHGQWGSGCYGMGNNMRWNRITGVLNTWSSSKLKIFYDDTELSVNSAKKRVKAQLTDDIATGKTKRYGAQYIYAPDKSYLREYFGGAEGIPISSIDPSLGVSTNVATVIPPECLYRMSVADAESVHPYSLDRDSWDPVDVDLFAPKSPVMAVRIAAWKPRDGKLSLKQLGKACRLMGIKYIYAYTHRFAKRAESDNRFKDLSAAVEQWIKDEFDINDVKQEKTAGIVSDWLSDRNIPAQVGREGLLPQTVGKMREYRVKPSSSRRVRVDLAGSLDLYDKTVDFVEKVNAELEDAMDKDLAEYGPVTREFIREPMTARRARIEWDQIIAQAKMEQELRAR